MNLLLEDVGHTHVDDTNGGSHRIAPKYKMVLLLGRFCQPEPLVFFVFLFVFCLFFRVEEKKKDNSIISTNLSDLNACRETFL
jgi:hypothetical protein